MNFGSVFGKSSPSNLVVNLDRFQVVSFAVFSTNGWYYSCGCETYPAITLQEVESSDGVVPVSSAAGFENAITDILPASNHQQMRNDRNTKIKLDKVLNGEYGQFFKTPIK